MDRSARMSDLAPDEYAVDRLLAAVPPVAPPIGFRDAVMRQLTATQPRTAWEWVVAAALVLPSFAFLAWDFAANGADFAEGINNALAAAQGSAGQVFFFVDGMVVLAAALLGLGSIVAAHALLVTTSSRAVAR
jgi:hypothetical protein